MKKNLKKFNRTKFKVKLSLFYDFLEFSIHCAIILFIAFIFDRLIQMALFILLFKIIQGCFKMQFHADTLFPDDAIKATKMCKIISIIIEIVYLIYCKNLNITIYANIFIILFIAFVNALLEFALRNIIIKKLNRREIILSIVENDEEKIDAFCKTKGLINYSEIIYLFLNNTIETVSEILNIPVRTINNKIDKFIKQFKG